MSHVLIVRNKIQEKEKLKQIQETKQILAQKEQIPEAQGEDNQSQKTKVPEKISTEAW